MADAFAGFVPGIAGFQAKKCPAGVGGPAGPREIWRYSDIR
jgi:hypothetical protein